MSRSSNTSPKQHVIASATQAAGGNPPCEPNADCQPCHRTDFQFLAVIPSVVPKRHEADLKGAGYAWAPSFDAEFGSITREATAPVARLVRQGFVFIYYVERGLWDVWQVMANGLTRKVMHQVSRTQYATGQSAFSSAAAPKQCSRGAANLPAHLISIPGAKAIDKVWVAFSPRLWSPAALQRFADNPEVEVLDASGKATGKNKLRALRGREISPKSILGGQFPAGASLPLNMSSLEHNVLDFLASKDGGWPSLPLKRAFQADTAPLDPVRFGKAQAFDQTVRTIERSSSPPSNRELYVNKSVILMLPDAEGVADAHNNIRMAAMVDHQAWMAGGVDADGNNADPKRPWERQSLVHAAYIREWVKDKERAVHKDRLAQGLYRTQTIISGFEYHKILEQEKRTGETVNPPGTTYERLSGQPERYRVTWPKAYVEEGIEGLAQAGSKDRIERYNSHLNTADIEAANKKWLDQERGWLTLLEARDGDYVRWLQTPVLQTTLRYDFDDHRALGTVQREAAALRADVQEAAQRLNAMAICYGGGACTNVSLKYFVDMFQKDEADPTHHLAQAMLGEFGLLEKVRDKAINDQGTQADFFDAITAKRGVWGDFKDAWQQVREQAAGASASLLQTAEQVTQRMREVALSPALAKQRGLQVALADAARKQVIWARAAGFANFLDSGVRQYMFGVKWSAGAFADASTVLTLQGPAVDVAERDVTGKQARKAAKSTRAELKPYLARNAADVEATIMLVVDEKQLARIANARGEKMLDIVSPGLFGVPNGVVSVPESFAREVVREHTRMRIGNLKTGSSLVNIVVLMLQGRAAAMSWEDIGKKGGMDQKDAIASMLGAVAGIAGASFEVGALLLTPPAANAAGMPLAAELASKIPAHLVLRFAAGLMLAAGSVFDAGVAFAKYSKFGDQGDSDAASAYMQVARMQLLGGISLGAGAYYAYRTALLNRLGQQAAKQGAVRLLGAAFSPIQLSRCLTGVGLLLWLGGLGLSFYALYLEDDDNEVFLRRSYFGKGHPQLGKFKDLDHEVQSFGELSTGSRAEMEWQDVWGSDELGVTIKLFKPEPTTVVTVLLQGFDDINGKKVADLYSGELPAPTLSTDKSDAASEIFTTEYTMKIPDGVEAVKLHYSVYKDRAPRTPPIARGELWIED